MQTVIQVVTTGRGSLRHPRHLHHAALMNARNRACVL